MDYAWFLFRLDGRINRAKGWLAVLIIVCWMMFLAALIIAVGGLFGGSASGSTTFFALSTPRPIVR